MFEYTKYGPGDLGKVPDDDEPLDEEEEEPCEDEEE